VRVRWLRTAVRTLDAQADHIARDDPAAALRTLIRVRAAVESLGKYPAMGRPGRVPLTRELVVSGTPFVVVYRGRADVEIIRVLHGAQSWPSD
jgi:toxin ParE1/3/4